MNGRIDGMDKVLAELSTSLRRNWEQTHAHSLQLARDEVRREVGSVSPSQPMASDRTLISVPLSMMRLMTWGTLALLVSVLVIAALAGVAVPKWLT